MLKKIKFLNFILFAVLFLNIKNSLAFSIITQNKTGDYRLGDFIATAISFAQYGLEIIGAIVLLFIIIGGFTLTISAGNQEMIERGRSMLVNSVIGLFIVLSSYLIVGTTLKIIGYNETIFGKWAEVPAELAPSTPPSSPSITPPSSLPQNSSTQKIAENIQTNYSKIVPDTNADCAGYSAQTTINDLAKGKLAKACSPSCDCTNEVSVNQNMLQATYDIGQKYNIRITSITTGKHSATSKHYSGNAIDIVPYNANNWQNIVNEYNTKGCSAYCEASGGALSKDCSSLSPNHVHVSCK